MSATILDLYRLLDDSETMSFPKADHERLKLVFELDPDVPQYIRAGQVKPRHALANLLRVALESNSQGSVQLRINSPVHTSQSPAGLRLAFTIQDIGPGIAAQKVKGLSGFCVPCGAIQHMPENSELTPAITFRYAQILGGTLTIVSQDGHGTKLVFDVPVNPVETGPVRNPSLFWRWHRASRIVVF